MSTAFVTGDKELDRMMIKLGKKIGDKAMSKAIGKAVRPIIQTAKANVRPYSTTVSKSVGVKRKKLRRVINVAIIGPRYGESVASTKTQINPITGEETTRTHKPWLTGHLIEGGTKAHDIHLPGRNLTIKHPGTTARPWMEPAFKEKSDASRAIYAKVLREEIAKHGNA